MQCYRMSERCSRGKVSTTPRPSYEPREVQASSGMVQKSRTPPSYASIQRGTYEVTAKVAFGCWGWVLTVLGPCLKLF